MAEKSGSETPPVFSNLPSAFQYSPSLNCIIALSKSSGIEVLDIHSCSVITQVPIDATEKAFSGCRYLDEEDKLIVCCGGRVGCRCASGEQIFLDTILQIPDVEKDPAVTVELDIVKTGLLVNCFEKCLLTNSVLTHDELESVTEKLRSCYEEMLEKMKEISSPEIKWVTVCLTMEYETLSKAFNTALLLAKQHHRGPALPVIGDVLQRLTSMQRITYDAVSSERRLMFNEVDRLQTFNSWPHTNYKWALPGPMAEAGFYHPHSTMKSAEDRAKCFTCSVCLVSWESSDQPWSEHKRHSRNCPYVLGDYTENVPLQVYSATAKAQELQRPEDEIVCMSSGCNNLIATGTKEGYIVIWSIYPTLKVHSEYQISVTAMKEKKKKTKPTHGKKQSDVPKTSQPEDEVNTETTEATLKTSPRSEDEPMTEAVTKSEIQIINEECYVDGYCIIEQVALLSKNIDTDVTTKPQTHSNDNSAKAKSFSPESLKSLDEEPENDISNSPSTDTSQSLNYEKTEYERKCNITSVAIIYDEKCQNTYVVAGVKIESRKYRKTKKKIKTKLSLLVYKLAGKAKLPKNGDVKDENGNEGNSMNEQTNPYLGSTFMPMGVSQPGEEYDYPVGEGDISEYSWDGELSVIDEYLMAAHKNPLFNGGTQNIALMNEVKSGFDQEEVVQIEDIKTVYEDCVFHKFDIDRTFYDKKMNIADLLVVDNYLVVILKRDTPAGSSDDVGDEPARNVMLVFSILTTSKQVTEIKLENSRILNGPVIHDAVRVLCKNLPPHIISNLKALEHFNVDCGGVVVGEKSCQPEPTMLLLTAMSDNTLSFLTVPRLAEQKLVTSLDTSRSIHKIAYCSALLSVAICDNKGCFHLQSCVVQPRKHDSKEDSADTPNSFKHLLQSGCLDIAQLNCLVEMTKFEPVTQGCYVFFPVNWYFSRTGTTNGGGGGGGCGAATESLKNSPAFKKHMFHLSPIEMDKRIGKQTGQTDTELTREIKFHMFVMAKTTLGYVDVVLNLKTPLEQTNHDFQCFVYIDDSADPQGFSQGSVDPDTENQADANNPTQLGTLVYGPVLFSDVTLETRSSGQFTILVPEMIHRKSVSIIVKLKPIITSSQNDTEMPAIVLPDKQGIPVSIIKDIYVGVHQFKALPTDMPFSFSGCQSVLVKDESIQVYLVERLLSVISQNGDLNEGGEVKLMMGVLLWIASVHCHSIDKDRLPLVFILEERMFEFMKATFMYGDRSLCHSSCQLLIALKRATKKPQFVERVLQETWKLLPHLHEASSSAAVHWMFILLLEFLSKDGQAKDQTNTDDALKRLTEMLLDVGRVYGNGLDETQRILDARYGLSDLIFQPVLSDPMYLKLKSGNAVKKAFGRVLETVKVSTDHLPGILEVQPLHFRCLSVSEGAKTEQLRHKAATATKSSKFQPANAATTNAMNPFVMQGFDELYNTPQANSLSEAGVAASGLVAGGSSGGVSGNGVVGGEKAVESLNDKSLELFSLISGNNPELYITEFPPFPQDIDSPLTVSGSLSNIQPSLSLLMQKPSGEKLLSNSQAEMEASREELVIPQPHCLLVDKMHVYSVHYVVLDFKTSVYLTDLILPPCKALASVTISGWDDGVSPEFMLATSNEIRQNALVLSNMVSPVQLRYVKIQVVGGDSCSAVIPLGQYYGHPVRTDFEAVEKLRKRFSDVFCRYALAVDRIIVPDSHKEMSTLKSSKRYNVLLSSLKKDYTLCSHLQFCMNFLSNNIPLIGARNLLQHRSLSPESLTSDSPLSNKSFSTQQHILTRLLKVILLHLNTSSKNDVNNQKNANDPNPTSGVELLSKEDFLLLFKNICVHGIGSSTQELVTRVLHVLCNKCTWWDDVMIDVFQMCFTTNTTADIPKKRLFNILMKMVQCSKGLSTIAEKFLYLLQQQVNSMLEKAHTDLSYNPGSLDWMLIAVTQILDHKDIKMWNFFNPWDHILENVPVQSTVTPQNGNIINTPGFVSNTSIKSPLTVQTTEVWHSQNKKLKTTPTVKCPATGKKSVPMTSCRVVKQKETHENNSTRVREDLEEVCDGAVEVAGTLFLSKSTCILTLSSLVKFILAKLQHGNCDHLILACKVCSLVLSRCQGLIHVEDFLHEDALKKLLVTCLSTDPEKKWIRHSINLFLQSIIMQKDAILKEIEMLVFSKRTTAKNKEAQLTPRLTQELTQENNEQPGPSSGATKAYTDQLKKFEQLKAMKESVNKKFFEATENKDFMNNKFNVDLPSSSDKYSELGGTAVQCNVMHPTTHGFHRILEVNLLKIQNELWNQQCELVNDEDNINTLSRQRIQKLWIPSGVQYSAEVMSMKASTMAFVCNAFVELLEDGELQKRHKGEEPVNVQTIQQLLFLLEMINEHDIKVDESVMSTLCDTILHMVTTLSFPPETSSITSAASFSSSVNIMHKYLLKKISKVLLYIPSSSASSFSLRLFQADIQHRQQVGLDSGGIGISASLAKLHFLSLEKLSTATELGDQERVLLKELLLMLCGMKETGATKLLSVVNSVLQNGILLRCDGGEREIEITRQLALLLSNTTMCFVRESWQLLCAAYQDRGDTKRTVFLLDNGKCRMSGKSHSMFTDMNLVLLFVAVVHEILTSQIMNSEVAHKYATETFSNLFRTLGYFKRMSTIHKANAYKPSSLNLPDQMLHYQSTSKLHPLASAIVYLLKEASQSMLLPVIIKSLVQVLETYVAANSSQSNDLAPSLEGIEEFIRNVVMKSSDAWQLFVKQGGFDLICSQVCTSGAHLVNSLNHMDMTRHSGILQEFHSSSIVSLSKNALQKEKFTKDEHGDMLQNLAPYAKIKGPAAGTGIEVLLVNKSPLRRSRYPAWGHHFDETDDCWITLEIVFPFEIMLKEIVIHMHGNYLIGGPSYVVAEVIGLSSFETVSPALTTGGLQSIVMHFAESLICKEVRLRLCRPIGSDHIRLNMIELFGKSIFSVDESGAISSHLKTLPIEPWMNLLTCLMTDQESLLHTFSESQYFDECISYCVKCMPFLSRLCLQQVASLIITKIIPLSSNNSLTIAALITGAMLRRDVLVFYSFSQLQLMVKFLYDVVRYSDESVKKSIYVHILDWLDDFLDEPIVTDSFVVVAIDVVVSKLLTKVKREIKRDLSQWKGIDSLVNKLQNVMASDSKQVNGCKPLFLTLGKLLNILASIFPSTFESFYENASTIVEKIKRCEEICENDQKRLKLAIYCSCSVSNQENCFSMLDNLAEHFVEILSRSKQHLQRSYGEIAKLEAILDIFISVFLCDHDTVIQTWFQTASGQRFWKPLLLFATCSDYDILAFNSSIMHQFVRKTVLLFRKILYLNPDTQEVFCQKLLQLLTELNTRTTFMSGYLKFLLHRLVISNDTILFDFKPRCGAYVLQNSHHIQLRLSSTIGEILQTLLKYRNQMNNPTGIPALTTQMEKLPDNNTLNEFEYVFQTGKAAAAKRKLKWSKGDGNKQGIGNKVTNVFNSNITVDFFLPAVTTQALPLSMTVGQIIQMLYSGDMLKHRLTLEYSISSSKSKIANYIVFQLMQQQPSMPSMLERFATNGGLPLLTDHLSSSNANFTTSSSYINLFSLILPLPGFAGVFLEDRNKAELLLRLMLGVKETRTGQPIHALVIAQDLSSLPLLTLRNLLQQSALQSEDGYELRKLSFERGVLQLVLENLKALYFQSGDERPVATAPGASGNSRQQPLTSNANQTYWAKGTGFGTGSTASNWDIEKALKQKKKKEKDIVLILQVLTAFIRKIPNTDVQVDDDRMTKLTTVLNQALAASCILDVLAGYLRNDSVLDMSRHIPLYHAVLALIRPLAYTKQTVNLFVQSKERDHSIVELLIKLKSCVGLYNSRLKATTKNAGKVDSKISDSSSAKHPLKERKDAKKTLDKDLDNEIDPEDLSLLLADINSTTDYAVLKVDEYKKGQDALKLYNSFDGDHANRFDDQSTVKSSQALSAEEIYVSEMAECQFDTYELVVEKTDGTLHFNVPYHYANMVRIAAKSADIINTTRARRLAQEVASLSTSLPISFSSTVFLQCDEERLDVMKVLITGPEGTPYENGCFEFDIYFPPDYPKMPMHVNLHTTGKNTVRFNPNLYNDGKVCLSILNTWHGRPEEKWNAQTSNLLQVLVSIQSLILVSDPYFNEPGYERLRGTPQGTKNSSEYNANIQQACVRWAILEQIKRPSACFKEIIHKHFVHKKEKVLAQCQQWLKQLKELSTKRKTMLHNYESLRSHFAELKFELAKLDKEHTEERCIPSNKPPSPSISSQTEVLVEKTNVSAVKDSVPENEISENMTSEVLTFYPLVENAVVDEVLLANGIIENELNEHM